MEHLFDPFRAHPAPKNPARSSRSLGLGLYIVSQIAGVHGGHVEVRSSASEGTTFTVHWPRAGV
jgi:signal transduction histidine kinase